jgi:acid ceramidase
LEWHDLNLDLDPKDRWTDMVKPKAAEIVDMIDQVINLVILKDGDSKVVDYLDTHADEVLAAMEQPFGDEIKGIAAATGIEIGKMILYNVAYELMGLCTSIVAQDSQGNIIHGRNLDFGLFMGVDAKNMSWTLTEKLRPLLFNVRVMKGGVNIYNMTQYAGYVGCLTCQKKGSDGFTLSVDTSFDDEMDKGIVEWLLGLNRNGTLLAILTRKAYDLETYDDALAFLQSTNSVGPAFIIVGGAKPGQGAVITKAGGKTIDTWTLQSQLDKNTFYLLETNYRHWKNPPFYDDRRNPGMQCMNEMGAGNLDFPGLFNVLSTRPNLNMLTTYTTLMSAAEGRLEAYTQRCPFPCTPW